MTRTLSRAIRYPALLVILAAALIAAHASPADEPVWPDFMDITSLDAMRAPLDTVVLYGGPGTAEGKFQVFIDGGPPDPQGWTSIDLTEVTLPVPDRAGDFAKLLPLLVDIDPCYENLTPQWTFIDDGTPVNNAPSISSAAPPPRSAKMRQRSGRPGGIAPGPGDDGPAAADSSVWRPPPTGNGRPSARTTTSSSAPRKRRRRRTAVR